MPSPWLYWPHNRSQLTLTHHLGVRCAGQNYDEFRNLVKASQLKPVNRSEMSQLFNSSSNHSGGASSGAAGMNKAFTGSSSSSSGGGAGGVGVGSAVVGGGGVGGGRVGGLRLYSNMYDPSAAAAERGRRVAASSASRSSSTQSSLSSGGGKGGGSLFDQSTPAELEGLDWNQKTGKAKSKKGKDKKRKSKSSKKSSPSTNGISPLQFEREWKRTCTDAASTTRYLLRTEPTPSASTTSTDSVPVAGGKRRLILPPEDVPASVFKIELSSDIMGDIIAALAYICRLASLVEDGSSSSAVEINDAVMALSTGDPTGSVGDMAQHLRASFVYRWMMAMTKCGRFGLNVSFLTVEQMEDAEVIFAALERYCGSGVEGYRYTEEDVLKLRDIYSLGNMGNAVPSL